MAAPKPSTSWRAVLPSTTMASPDPGELFQPGASACPWRCLPNVLHIRTVDPDCAHIPVRPETDSAAAAAVAVACAGCGSGLDNDAPARASVGSGPSGTCGATVLEVPHLLHGGAAASIGPVAWIAGIVSGIMAYLSTWFLMRYFGRHDFQALDPFAYYCAAIGLLSLGFFLVVA